MHERMNTQHHTHWHTHPIRAFDKTTPWSDNAAQVKITAEDARQVTPRKNLCCVNCRYQITSLQAALEINDQHYHVYSNPYGETFEIRLFSTAACVRQGDATTDFTWFSGYAWQNAMCGNCRLQLGWVYSQAGAADFYGLIAARLTHSHG